MFAKRNLIAILVIALLIFVGYPAKADFAAEGLGGKWYEDDYTAADSDLMDNAYKAVADTWLAMTGMVGGIIGGGSDDFEDAPRMESPEPKQQFQYRYVPRHTTGYPKWIREPVK